VAGCIVLHFYRRIKKQEDCSCGCAKCDGDVKIGASMENRVEL
jgi:hypothetical protein